MTPGVSPVSGCHGSTGDGDHAATVVTGTGRCGAVAANPGIPQVRSSDALGLVRAAVDLADADDGGGVAVGVVDGTGELVAFLRSDGAPLRAIRIAMMKAYTAARFGRETAAVAEALQVSGRALGEYGDRRFTALSGGVPLVDERGRVAGGLGVSGRAPEEDHALAMVVVAGGHRDAQASDMAGCPVAVAEARQEPR